MDTDFRWNSPFQNTIAFELFHKHFTELNNIYWANAPASATIERIAIKSNKAPLDFFLVHDEDDRRIARDMLEWKNNYREFLNYNRLNMLMNLSSAFETYLRTVVSLALESKPGTLILSKDSVDGAKLLINDISYGNSKSKTYLFTDYITSICVGDWHSRIENFKKIFIRVPEKLIINIDLLNEFRNKRNSVGHYIGRTKNKYETPLNLDSLPAERLSHEKLMQYFKMIFDVSLEIDTFLQSEYIGSYDIIKYYKYSLEKCLLKKTKTGERAKEFQKIIGCAGKIPVGTKYYKWLVHYVEQNVDIT